MADDGQLPTDSSTRSVEEYAECEDLNVTYDDLDIHDSFLEHVRDENESASLREKDSVDCSPESRPLQESDQPLQYILGTLVVRVVAARDLDSSSSNQHNALSSFLFGAGGGGGPQKGAAAYASVRFGSTTQRTSQAHDVTDPTWPRGEAMYMDVTHPAWDTAVVVTDETQENREEAFDKVASLKDPPSDPGDPPKKVKPLRPARKEQSTDTGSSVLDNVVDIDPPPRPILTVALFHAPAGGKDSSKQFYNPSKQQDSGDSDDVFLGMTTVDLTHVLTGKVNSLDEWVPLQGGSEIGNAINAGRRRSSVRIVCEYEASDAAPQPQDQVTFTQYCNPHDIYPAIQQRTYSVTELDGDSVLIEWTSPEGWVSSFLVHRYMLICSARHHSVVGACQDELACLRERLAHSPMIHVVQETVDRVPDEGLLAVSNDAINQGVSLLSRWFEGGVEVTARDLTFATNWDGRHNPSTTDSLSTASEVTRPEQGGEHDESHCSPSSSSSLVDQQLELDGLRSEDPPPLLLPNMPACPITGEPMRDPVVAADGHTYERSAIFRWLQGSNKSPLTGSVLPHKDLVPNYMLLSSLRDQVATQETIQEASQSSPADNEMEDVFETVEDVDINETLNETSVN